MSGAAARRIKISHMGIRISQGGRLFGIVAGLGGVAMIGSAALTWPAALAITPGLRGDQ